MKMALRILHSPYKTQFLALLLASIVASQVALGVGGLPPNGCNYSEVVMARGVGQTHRDAVLDALVSALEQVKGLLLHSSSYSSMITILGAGDESTANVQQSYREDISTQTAGVVLGYSVLDTTHTGNRFSTLVRVEICQDPLALIYVNSSSESRSGIMARKLGRYLVNRLVHSKIKAVLRTSDFGRNGAIWSLADYLIRIDDEDGTIMVSVEEHRTGASLCFTEFSVGPSGMSLGLSSAAKEITACLQAKILTQGTPRNTTVQAGSNVQVEFFPVRRKAALSKIRGWLRSLPEVTDLHLEFTGGSVVGGLKLESGVNLCDTLDRHIPEAERVFSLSLYLKECTEEQALIRVLFE